MKYLIGVILLVAMAIIGLFANKTHKETHKLRRPVFGVLWGGFVIVFVNIVSLFTTSEAVCLLMYSLYFMVVDWMLYYLLQFSIEYIGNRFEDYVNRKVMVALLFADSVSILLNNIFKHLFSLNPVTMFGGESYFELILTPYFYIHYVIILMLVTFCLISLFYRTFTAPMFYRKKYLIIAIVTVILVVMNFFMLTAAIDFSVAGYVVEAVCIYYCAFVYTPQRLLPETLHKVANDMSVALLLLDVEGKKIYNNKCAEWFLSEDEPLLNTLGVSLEQWCQDVYTASDEDFTEDITFYKNGEKVYLRIQLQRMKDINNQLQSGYFVIQNRTEEIENLKRERYLSTHDSLTGLYNKKHFYEKSEQYIKSHQDKELLMICTDIKDFKMINDFFGTSVGDDVLVSFAQVLRERIKDAVVYGRIGNDIFAVLMEKDKFSEDMFIRETQEALLSCMGENVSFPVINYVGVYEITEPSLLVSVMCDRARMAIATIKGDYHKRVAYYDKRLRENILHEQELISDLDEAIVEGQLKMFLQPQMSSEGKILGAEALVRWIHPVKGQIMPGDFIPIFEKNGLISDVDKYIWEVACKQLRKWKDEGREDLYISVNISPRDFYFLNIYKIFTELIKKYNINPKNLKLEITETAIVMDFKRQMELISRLRQNGFIVEMDDFGSGYSSLNMLKDLHVDVLKIDMAFLKKAEDEERSKKILQMIISLSKQLGMPVITEGVETVEQVAALKEMGCDIFQGYYFAKPMPVDAFEETYLK